MRTLLMIAIGVVGTLLLLAAYAYSGLYDVAADSAHWKITANLMETSRDRFIERRASAIAVPDNLNDENLVLKGAGQYAAMCVGCHLAPGKSNSELRQGLSPLPPNLSEHAVDPRAAFWVIKHGIKMTAMPAWGASHDDATIWSLVAFLQRLPKLDEAHYNDIVARAPADEEMSEDHPHSHPHSHPAAHGSEHSMPMR